MKLDEIRKIARENEVTDFFKEMYRHSIQVLESIPDDEMKKIISYNRNGLKIPRFPNGKEVNLGYEYGVINSFRFGNEMDDHDLKDKNHVFFEAELIGTVKGRESNDFVEYRSFKSNFDYRYLIMSLYLGKKEVLFEFVLCNHYDESEEDKAFIKALQSEKFLENVFGKNLIRNYSGGFTVAESFFED